MPLQGDPEENYYKDKLKKSISDKKIIEEYLDYPKVRARLVKPTWHGDQLDDINIYFVYKAVRTRKHMHTYL